MESELEFLIEHICWMNLLEYLHQKLLLTILK